MNRRSFIKLSGAAMVAAGVKTASAAELNRLKVGVICDEISDDFEEALRFLKRYGLRYVEVRKVWDKYITEADDATVRKVRALLDRYQIQTPMMDTAYLKTTLPGTKIIEIDRDQFQLFDLDYRDQPALLERSIERAKQIGAPCIRIFSFWRTANPLSLVGPIAEHLTRAAELAAQRKLHVVLENEHSCNVGTGEETAAVFRNLKHPNLGLNWDPGNTYALGKRPYPDEYAMIPKARIWHTHFKDAVRNPKTRKQIWMPIGKGEIDYLGMVRAMLKDGFQGMFSLETHYKHPSGNKERASKESVEGLLDTLKKA